MPTPARRASGRRSPPRPAVRRARGTLISRKGEYSWKIIREHYQLHQWESEDSFLRTDFNADFAKIDGAIAACSHTVKGAYTGNGSYLTVELGFRPAAVLVSLGYQSYNQPRLSIDGDTAYMVMTDSGFRVQDDRNANLNAGRGENICIWRSNIKNPPDESGEILV